MATGSGVTLVVRADDRAGTSDVFGARLDAAGAFLDPLPLQHGDATRLRLASAAPQSLAIVAWSATSTPLPLFGGVFHASPASFFATLPTDSLGRFDVTFTWPTVPPGATFYQQAAVLDPAAAFGVSMSNGLRAVTR